MKFPPPATIVLMLTLLVSAAGWDCDEKCPNYDECIEEEKERAKGNPRRTLVDENEPNLETATTQEKEQVHPALRGPTGEGNENQP